MSICKTIIGNQLYIQKILKHNYIMRQQRQSNGMAKEKQSKQAEEEDEEKNHIARI